MDSMERNNSSVFLVLAIVVVLLVGGVAIYFVSQQDTVTPVPIAQQTGDADLQAKLAEQATKSEEAAAKKDELISDLQAKIDEIAKKAQEAAQTQQNAQQNKSALPAMEFEFTSAFLQSGSFEKSACEQYRILAVEFADEFKDGPKSDFEDKISDASDEIGTTKELIIALKANVTNATTFSYAMYFSTMIDDIIDAKDDAEDSVADAESEIPYVVKNTVSAKTALAKLAKASSKLSDAEDSLDEAETKFDDGKTTSDISKRLQEALDNMNDAEDELKNAKREFKSVKDDVENRFLTSLAPVCK